MTNGTQASLSQGHFPSMRLMKASLLVYFEEVSLKYRHLPFCSEHRLLWTSMEMPHNDGCLPSLPFGDPKKVFSPLVIIRRSGALQGEASL